MKFSIIILFILLFNSTLYTQTTEGYSLRQLTFSPYFESNPQWSSDGKSIYFDSKNENTIQIYKLNTDSLMIEQLTFDSIEKSFCMINPANKQMVINDDQNLVLLTFDIGQNNYKKLIKRDIQSKEVQFNPTGNLAAMIGKSDVDKYWRIFTYDFKYTNLNTFMDPISDCSFPRWSPKGESISYTVGISKDNTKQYIQIIQWYGKEMQQITDSILHVRDACWSSHFGKIAFIGETSDSSYLFVSQKDGTKRETIYRDTRPLKTPSWSPDRQSIIFTIEETSKQQHIYQIVFD